jgi:hypothetical protein
MNQRAITITGSVFLLMIAILHSSGAEYLIEQMQASNVNPLVKNIFPVLFIHPTIQLVALAVLGLILTFQRTPVKLIWLWLAGTVLLDALLAFFLKAWLPGLILLLPVGCYIMGYFRKDHVTNDKPST